MKQHIVLILKQYFGNYSAIMCSNDQTIIYDFETTGLNPFHDNIIEFAFSNINTKITISGLVNPGYPISNEIIKLTKILKF